ncbi:DUF4214 domain-containing protein [Aliarcobacter cryaerophilus]|uniref:DUF4214 domain-containing protein n=1 Tax=Aliarcobacter cryaerophilus TaxID=28198 RepID=UPI0021B47D12|nr:DUF4214 domain-containing protein [Aliarcobacter cryaerophilus]MCT7506320.1 DUF4214 domain-containing protein [Aliarcobacter cryaerophilus]
MALTQGQVSQLYVALFGRASEGAGNKGWIDRGLNQVETANKMIDSPAAKDYFGGELTNLEFVTFIYANTLGFTHDKEGIANWTAKLDAGISRGELVVDMITAALSSEFEGSAPQNQLLNRIEVSDYMATNVENVAPENVASTQFVSARYPDAGLDVTDSASTVTAAEKIIDEMKDAPVPVPGYTLEVSRDKLTGTAKDDLFIADVVQNQNGAQVNTLGSGDIINGGAGNDTLDATLISAYNVAGKPMDITPTTKSVENIIINAQISENNSEASIAYSNALQSKAVAQAAYNAAVAADTAAPSTDTAAAVAAALATLNIAQAQVDALAGAAGDLVVLNARKMEGVTKISSKYSDADLLVKNLQGGKNTDGTKYISKDMTIGMEYTGNKDSNWDEANMTVFYDQDYLVRSAVQTNSVYYFTQDRLATNEDNKVFGEKTAVDGIAFTASDLGRVEIKIPEASLEAFLKTVPADSIQAYQGFVALLKTALDAKNTELNGALSNYDIKLNTDYFRTNGGVNNSGDPLKTNAYAIELLVPSGVTVTDPAMSQRTKTLPTYDMFNDVTKVPPTTTDVAVKINVDLEKVGLAADGGALIIGSMNKDAGNNFNIKQAITTTKTVAGFDEFNVHVSGDKSKNSSLSKLISTDNTLRKVTIDSKAGSVANLTIGNSNTPALGTSAQNAAAFKDVQVMDASSFAGDLKLNAGFTTELKAKYFDNADSKSGVYTTLYGLNVAKTELALFSYKGGAGNDTLNLAFDQANFGYSFGQVNMATNLADTNANGTQKIFANVFKTVVEGGAGNDTINITLDGTAATGYTLGATNMTINGGAGNDTINLGATTVGGTGSAGQSSFTVAFNSTFGHDIINNFQVSGAGIGANNSANKTEEVQSLNLTGFEAHAGETVVVTVGDKTYSYTLKTAETTATALTFITDVLTANTAAGTNNNVNLTEAYFTTAALTAGANTLIGNTVTAGAKNGYADKNVGTVKVEIATGSETNVNFEKVAPLHSYTADTIQQGGILWYGNAAAGLEAGNGADFLDFTAYSAKGVIMLDNNGTANSIATAGKATAGSIVGDKLVFLIESAHDAGVYNAYTADVKVAGNVSWTDATNGVINKTLLGSIDLGRDVNTSTPATDINADQFLF